MSCFTKKEVKNPKFPNLSAEVTRLKTTEGGASAACAIMQEYEEKAVLGLLQIADAAKEAGITEDDFEAKMAQTTTQ